MSANDALSGEWVRHGPYGHTLDDLRRLRLVVSETHPHVEFMLEADGEITHWDGDIDPVAVRRASDIAGISDRCWACWNAEPDLWYGEFDGCVGVQRPPYLDDCGRTERTDRLVTARPTGRSGAST